MFKVQKLGISRACAHLFFRNVFRAGMHFSNIRPVEFRRLANVSDTQHTCTCCSCLVVCAIYMLWFTAGQGLELYFSGVVC